MKRNIDLIRKLLIYLEEKKDDRMIKEMPKLDDHNSAEVMYHFVLMDEAKLIRCEREVTESGRVIKVYPFTLTWHGHEFLEASRNEDIWNKAKTVLKAKSGSLSFDLLKALLISMLGESLGLN
jgi:hypothetical protein